MLDSSTSHDARFYSHQMFGYRLTHPQPHRNTEMRTQRVYFLLENNTHYTYPEFHLNNIVQIS